MTLEAGRLVLTIFFCCAMTMMVLTACSDKNDNPTPSEEQTSAVDNGVWLVTPEVMDPSYRLGDDFYMYCTGGFWKTTTVDESKRDINLGMMTEADELMKQRLAALNIPARSCDAQRCLRNVIAASRSCPGHCQDSITTVPTPWLRTLPILADFSSHTTPICVTSAIQASREISSTCSVIASISLTPGSGMPNTVLCGPMTVLSTQTQGTCTPWPASASTASVQTLTTGTTCST